MFEKPESAATRQADRQTARPTDDGLTDAETVVPAVAAILVQRSAVRCSARTERDRRCKPFLISGESTNVQRLSTVSVTAGAPLTKVARVCPPGPASRNGPRQSIPVAWGRDMQSSLLSPYYSVLSCQPVLPVSQCNTCGTAVRYTNTLSHTGTAGQASPNEEFCRKISGRLKSNFFSLVPARRLPRPTILDPGPYQPSLARVLLAFPFTASAPVDIIIR